MARSDAVWGIDIGQCALKALRCRAGDQRHQIVADAFDYIEYPKILSQAGAEPTELIEADQESVIANLVASGVGLSLIREDLALEKQASGEMCLWRDVRLESTLWFIYLRARKDDPAILALLSLLRDVWNLPEHKAHDTGRRS